MKYKGSDLEASFFLKFISYDPESGNLYWQNPISNRVRKGSIAGNVSQGYIKVGINGNHYLAHRVAWLLHTGRWPKEHIDHINGDGTDNRICNLRECTYGQNAQNRLKKRTKSSNPKSKHIGVYWNKKNKKWECSIGANGKTYRLGLFSDESEAHQAYLKKKKEIHEFKEIRVE